MIVNNMYPRVSKLRVLESAAGFYIGRVYMHSEDEYEPYSRESAYMVDRNTAESALIDNSYVQNLS